MPKVELRQEASSRLQAGGAPEIGKEFVGTLDRAINAREQLRVKRQSLAKDAFDNAADTERVKATSIVATEEGTNALEAARKQREILRKSLETQLSKLSPEYQDYLKPELDQHIAKYDQTVIPHTYRESKKLEDNIKKERIVHNRNDAILMSQDADSFDSVGLNRVFNKTVEYAQLKYGQDLEAEVPGMPGVKVKEIIHQTAQTAVSDTIVGAIEQQASVGNIQKAKELGDRFVNELMPADRIKAIKAIEKSQNSLDNDIALSIANEAERVSPDNLGAQERYIRANVGSTKLYKQALDVARYRSTIREKDKKKQDEKVQADINASIMDGTFNPSQVKGLAPDKQSKVLKFATDWNQKKFIKTDDKVFKELDDMILDDPRSYSELNLMAYRDTLNDREFRSLKMAQDRIRSEGRSEQRRISMAPDKIIYGIRKEFIANKGLYGEEAAIYKMSREFIEEELERNPKITPAELRKKYAAALYDRGVKKEKNPDFGVLAKIKNKLNLPFTSITPEEIEKVQPTLIEEAPIHPSHINYLKKQRPELSEAAIMEYLNGKKKEGLDLSTPRK
jgi:hypothetical protein